MNIYIIREYNIMKIIIKGEIFMNIDMNIPSTCLPQIGAMAPDFESMTTFKKLNYQII